MCHLVQVLEQHEVCGEEDVCSTFGHQVAVMVSGVPIHLWVKPDCQSLPDAVDNKHQHCHFGEDLEEGYNFFFFSNNPIVRHSLLHSNQAGINKPVLLAL